LKIAYFDCFSGISGDMCLGAIVDAGVPLKKLREELKKIPVKGHEIKAKKVKRGRFSSTKVDVIQSSKFIRQGRQSSRNWRDIEKIIKTSSLPKETKQKGLGVFKRLFDAEAKVHGKTFDKVHLHELGYIDCLIDIFGTIIGLDMLKVEKVYSSPVNLGSGSIRTEHGILPVPAPATTEILKGVTVYSSDTPFELTTPTGAAILKEFSSGFGIIPHMNIEKTGIGAGSNNFKDRPNLLRLFIGEEWSSAHDRNDETVILIEVNIDDMNPQIYEYVIEKLFKAGAIDVFLTQVLMKKGRPGIKLSVLCKDDDKEGLIRLIMKETTTIGLRFHEVKRKILQREIKLVDTEFGKVRVKFSRLGDEILKATPEYEDCKRIAKKLNVPLIEFMRRIKIQ
jgi:uncharacterized protein (TIGR00299 family) protein